MINRPSPAAHEGADQGAGASETPTQLVAENYPASRSYVVDGRTPQPAPKNAVCRLRRQLRAGRDLNGPTRRAGAWVGAGAAPDFRYPPYDINALAFSSPAHSIRWAVKVSRATAPGFGSYVGV